MRGNGSAKSSVNGTGGETEGNEIIVLDSVLGAGG